MLSATGLAVNGWVGRWVGGWTNLNEPPSKIELVSLVTPFRHLPNSPAPGKGGK